MLRLTTNVTVSPASSARSSSAAWRMSSIDLGPRLGEERGELVRVERAAPSRARATVSGRSAPFGPSSRPEPRRGMKLQ